MKTISVIMVTVNNLRNARKIAEILLKERLVACINIIKNIDSFYWWKGKIEKGKEVLLIIKTRKYKIKKLIKRVKEIHPYSVPEIVAWDIKKGNIDYINWIYEVTD